MDIEHIREWIGHLSESEQREFLLELVDACDDDGMYSDFIAAWKTTAEAHGKGTRSDRDEAPAGRQDSGARVRLVGNPGVDLFERVGGRRGGLDRGGHQRLFPLHRDTLHLPLRAEYNLIVEGTRRGARLLLQLAHVARESLWVEYGGGEGVLHRRGPAEFLLSGLRGPGEVGDPAGQQLASTEDVLLPPLQAPLARLGQRHHVDLDEELHDERRRSACQVRQQVFHARNAIGFEMREVAGPPNDIRQPSARRCRRSRPRTCQVIRGLRPPWSSRKRRPPPTRGGCCRSRSSAGKPGGGAAARCAKPGAEWERAASCRCCQTRSLAPIRGA
jgi:hypothetical protein